jgi:GNAT superfamily N-acetyltransferase
MASSDASAAGGDIGNIGIKEIGRFTRQVRDAVDGISSGKASKHDLYSELSIELDGISELTRIDPNRFLKVVQKATPRYDEIVKDYRKKVFKMTGYALTNDIVDSIVEVMVSLNLLRELVFEAGGYERALEHACDRYGTRPDALEVRADDEGLVVVRLTEKHEIDEASRLITSFYGPKVAEELYSIFMISRVGSLLAVKDPFGKILGVVQLLYDRWGDSYVHAYCVLKSYRGSGVASVLLDAVEKHSKGENIWATRSLDMVYNIRSFLQRGYRGRAYIRDYWGKGVPRIVFEKKVGLLTEPPGSRQYDAPHLGQFNPSVGRFTASLDSLDLIETALNEHGYEIADLFCRLKVGGEPDTVFLCKASGRSVFLGRDHELRLPSLDAGGYKPVTLKTYADIHEAIGLEDAQNADPREDYGTFKMLTYVGAMVGLRDGKGTLAACAGLVWDGEGGLLCHSLTAAHDASAKDPPPKDNGVLGGILVRYVCDLAADIGLERVCLFCSLEDMVVVKALVNGQGFQGVQEFLNPYDNGQNYLLLRKELKRLRSWPDADPQNAPLLRSSADLKQEYVDVRVPSRNYGLTVMVLKEGYVVRAVFDAPQKGGAEAGQPTLLLSR